MTTIIIIFAGIIGMLLLMGFMGLAIFSFRLGRKIGKVLINWVNKK